MDGGRGLKRQKDGKMTERMGTALGILFWIAVWQLVSMKIGNHILAASPIQTGKTLAGLLVSAEVWKAVGSSFAKIALGFFLGVTIGILLAVLAALFRAVRYAVTPILRLVKAVPVASFIILALLWVSSKHLSVLISFLMVLPVIYTNVFQGIVSTDQELCEMAAVFRLGLGKCLRYIYLPAVLPYFVSACSVGLGFCFKSGIAAEIIGLPDNSIGEKLYEAKLYLMTPELFAWTVIIVFISVCFERAVMFLIRMAALRLGGYGKKPVGNGTAADRERDALETADGERVAPEAADRERVVSEATDGRHAEDRQTEKIAKEQENRPAKRVAAEAVDGERNAPETSDEEQAAPEAADGRHAEGWQTGKIAKEQGNKTAKRAVTDGEQAVPETADGRPVEGWPAGQIAKKPKNLKEQGNMTAKRAATDGEQTVQKSTGFGLFNVSKSFDGKPVLCHFTLPLPVGVTALMGPSGCGKSTAGKLLLSLLWPEEGTVSAPGKCAAVFQEDRLCMEFDAVTNVAMVCRDRVRAEKALLEVGLGGLLGKPVSEFSGGMRRRTAIVRALLSDAELLVLDEPFTGLDEAGRHRMMEWVKKNIAGRSVLLITHHVEEARELAQRVISIK